MKKYITKTSAQYRKEIEERESRATCPECNHRSYNMTSQETEDKRIEEYSCRECGCEWYVEI